MADVTKFAVKRINLPLLFEQLQAVGLGQPGLLMAGFQAIRSQRYDPFAVRTAIGRSGDVIDFADPGELRFRFRNPLTAGEDTALDNLLAAHDATQNSTGQDQKQEDEDSIPTLVNNYNNWGTLTDVQKDANARQLTRLVARLLDSTQNL